jgi:hypothetical protein
MMKLTMTVRASSNGVVDGVRPAFSQRSDMMAFEKGFTIRAPEGRRPCAHFTHSVGRLEDPCEHVWIPHKSGGRSHDLLTAWRA